MGEWDDMVIPLLRFINDEGPLERLDGDAWNHVARWADTNGHDERHVRRRFRLVEEQGLVETRIVRHGNAAEPDAQIWISVEITAAGLRTIDVWPSEGAWVDRFSDLIEEAIDRGLVDHKDVAEARVVQGALSGFLGNVLHRVVFGEA